MCLAVPGKIVEIKNKQAKIDMNGVFVKAGTDLVDDVKIGDFVIVHSGFILQKMSLEEAQQTIDLIEQMQVQT